MTVGFKITVTVSLPNVSFLSLRRSIDSSGRWKEINKPKERIGLDEERPEGMEINIMFFTFE